MQQLSLPVSPFEYRIRRSTRAKRLRVSVSPLGVVEVVAPRSVSSNDVQDFVQAHDSWITRKKSEIDCMRDKELNDLRPGYVNLPAVSEHWKLSYLQGSPMLEMVTNSRSTANPVTKDKNLRLFCRQDNEVSQLLKGWLTSRAKATLLPWLQRTSDETGMSFRNAGIRGQKSRWASCSSKKNISLNRCMLFLEAEQVRYLMVHELCHTREMNHSPRFWKLVERFCPDYRLHEKAINACCYRLPRWVF